MKIWYRIKLLLVVCVIFINECKGKTLQGVQKVKQGKKYLLVQLPNADGGEMRYLEEVRKGKSGGRRNDRHHQHGYRGGNGHRFCTVCSDVFHPHPPPAWGAGSVTSPPTWKPDVTIISLPASIAYLPVAMTTVLAHTLPSTSTHKSQ